MLVSHHIVLPFALPFPHLASKRVPENDCLVDLLPVEKAHNIVRECSVRPRAAVRAEACRRERGTTVSARMKEEGIRRSEENSPVAVVPEIEGEDFARMRHFMLVRKPSKVHQRALRDECI